MHVRFSRVNTDDNRFDRIGYVSDVTADDFERMRRECAANDGDSEDLVADLMEGFDLLDVVIMSRQMHLRAASILKLR